METRTLQLQLGAVAVDLEGCEVARGQDREPLTPTEVALLKHLAERPGQAVSRQELLVDALGYSERSRSRAVDHAMARLRKKLEEDPTEPRYLIAIRGVGYRLDLPQDPDFVGRAADLQRVMTALAEGPVAVVGPGGVGKTRLARAVAERWRGEATFVALAAAHTADEVAERLLAAVDPRSKGGRDAWARLATVLDRCDDPLLVLDNLEQIPDPELDVALDRLRDAASLLLTSRRAPQDAAFRAVSLAPLDHASAAELYLTRARERWPEWQPEPADIEAIDAFVDAVDRLPLAIELAASRIRVLPPSDAAARAGTLRGKTTGHEAASLDECIGWSWELLDRDHRTGWLAAACFEDGFELGIWEAVAGLDEPLDVLEDLLAHHLVVRDGRRFRMLITLRTFARERLDQTGLGELLRPRMWTALAEACQARARTDEMTGDLGWFETERANLVRVVRDALGPDPERALSCLRALDVVLQDRGPASLRLELHDLALAAAERVSTSARERLLARSALAQVAVGRRERAAELAGRARAAIPELDDPTDRCRAWLTQGALHLHLGELTEAVDALERCAAEGSGHDDFLVGLAHYNRGYALELLDRGDDALAATHLAVAHLDAVEAHTMRLAAHGLLATQLLNRDRNHAAGEVLDRADAIDAPGRGLISLDTRATRGRWQLAMGDLAGARATLEEVELQATEDGFDTLAADCAAHAGIALALAGDPGAESRLAMAGAALDRCGRPADAEAARQLAAIAAGRATEPPDHPWARWADALAG